MKKTDLLAPHSTRLSHRYSHTAVQRLAIETCLVSTLSGVSYTTTEMLVFPQEPVRLFQVLTHPWVCDSWQPVMELVGAVGGFVKKLNNLLARRM